MVATRHDEVERKYDVDPDTVLPTLADLDGVSAMGQAVEHELVAVYFDTATLDLARHGATLRRRTGGDDAGWHLKVPNGPDTRTEWHLPLGRASKTVPTRLLLPVRWLVRDRRLVPVIRVRTRRLEYSLVGPEGIALARICDDQVHTERLGGVSDDEGSGTAAWREWEVELAEGPPALLHEVEHRLIAAGASPSTAVSKLTRSLGDAIPAAAGAGRKTPGRKKLARDSAAQLVRTQLAAQVADLHAHDSGLRTGDKASVHKFRIAGRRLRATLKSFQPLLEPGAAQDLGEELRWLGHALADARDAQVLREHLQNLIASEPAELVLGPVSARIEGELSSSHQAGLEEALAALDSERYFRLLDALDEFVTTPPLTSAAEDPATKLLPRLLERDAKRLRRAVRQVGTGHEPEHHDAALHEARKKAKRLRYAAESAVPVLGKRAKKLATVTKNIQRALGEHQDTVVARTRLREYGVQAHLAGENGFTFGRLHALEQARADQSEREFKTAWKALPSKKLDRWIRT